MGLERAELSNSIFRLFQFARHSLRDDDEGGRERGADQRKEAKFVKMALAAVSTESNQSGWGKGYARARFKSRSGEKLAADVLV